MFNLNKNIKILDFFLILSLVIIGIFCRFLPHLPNFTPISAIALFGGVYLSRKFALILPILTMIISDFFIGYYEIGLMLSVYGSFVLCVLLGFWLKNNKKSHFIFGTSILSAVIFFLITNFAVWFFTPWYSKDFLGLFNCYIMALPFLRNSLLGDVFYVTVFFGTYETIRFYLLKRIPKSAFCKI